MTKVEILQSANQIFNEVTEMSRQMDTAAFFEKKNGKWSVAENVQHLILSARMTNLAYRLPLILVRLLAGKSNRPSKTFEELQNQYFKKLEEGAKASASFVPKPLSVCDSKEKLMEEWEKISSGFYKAVQNKRTEKDLDIYLVKHPLLGKITLRELCYFTIFHTRHHLETIHKLSQAVI